MSDRERWVRTAREAPRWDDRNRLIAAHVPDGVSVLDLGAGAQTLRERLPAGCRYQAVDLVPGPGVIECDFNAGEYPRLDEPADFAVCSGVLEYLTDPGALLSRLPALAREGIVTYAAWRPYQLRAERTRAGWVNHLPAGEFAALVSAGGLRWTPLAEWRGQLIGSGGDGVAPGPEPPEPEGWGDGLSALRAFAERQGHAYLKPGAEVDGFLLGDWVRAQQAAWRDGALAPRLARTLEAVPGWGWAPADALWQMRLEQLRRKGARGSLLRQWLAEQEALRAAGELHPDRVAALAELTPDGGTPR